VSERTIARKVPTVVAELALLERRRRGLARVGRVSERTIARKVPTVVAELALLERRRRGLARVGIAAITPELAIVTVLAIAHGESE
jgi:hypothetical protein